MRIFLLIIAGIAGGIIGGMGMGGGTLLIPILTVFLDVNQHLAQWINLVTFIPMSIAALIIHIKNRLVEKKPILIILLPAFASAFLASLLAIQSDSALLGRLFGGFLVALGVLSIVLTIIKNKREKADDCGKDANNS